MRTGCTIKVPKNFFFELQILWSLLILLLALSGCSYNKSKSTSYINGKWLINDQFVDTTVYVKDGRFSFKELAHIDNRVNLQGNYVIPPFGDAHTHNFDDPKEFDSIYQAYLSEGTFYVQVLTNHYTNYLKIKDSINVPGKIDVKFAHGGITSTGGHPHNLYESNSLGYSWRAMFDPEKRKELKKSRTKAGDAYYLVDSITQFNNLWPKILKNSPDLIKIYLLNTNERMRRTMEGEIGSYGLSSKVAKVVIDSARSQGLRVYAHIQNLEDFGTALELGIKHFAHMPGYGGGLGNSTLEELTMSDSLLHRAAQQKITIIPTVSFAKYYAMKWDGSKMIADTVKLKKTHEFLKEQLSRFHTSGITIALGADQHNSILSEEINDIIEIGAFNNTELLNILTRDTPKTIFPNRKIGAFKEGYEASFLVLAGNPLEDIENIRKITYRVKDGILLD